MAQLAAKAPGSLDCRPQRGGFGLARAHHWQAEQIGQYLAPQLAFCRPAHQADFAALQAAGVQQVQAIAQAEASAFEHGPAQVGAGQVGAGHAMQAGAGSGQRRYAFAIEKRQHQQAVGAKRRLRGEGREAGEVKLQQVTHQRAGVGQVHRADQGQPATAGGAEVRHLTLGVELGMVGVSCQGTRGAQAEGDHARADIAGTDGAEHVVAAAGGHPGVRVQPQACGGLLAQRADAVAGGEQLGQCRQQALARFDVLQHIGCPAVVVHVVVTGARRIARLAAGAACQPVIEVIVGQQHMGQAGEQVGEVPFAPQQLGYGITRRNHQPQAFDRALRAAERVQQCLVFCRGFGVAPELGRAQYLALGVQHHQAMLLAGYRQRTDGLAIDAGLMQRASDCRVQGGEPVGRVLLAAPVAAPCRRVRGTTKAQHPATAGVQHQRLGTLGTAINAEKQSVHCVCSRSVAKHSAQRLAHANLTQAVIQALESADEGTGGGDDRAKYRFVAQHPGSQPVTLHYPCLALARAWVGDGIGAALFVYPTQVQGPGRCHQGHAVQRLALGNQLVGGGDDVLGKLR
ncbi:hypothetical protein D3C79_632980 [compost metagenome]